MENEHLEQMLFTNYINQLVHNSSNRIAPDETQRIAASHLGLFCLHMSHKNDVRLIWVNILSDIVLHIKRTTGA